MLFVDEIHRLNRADRGDPLPGARGLPARHHRRPGPGRADAHARPAAVHARRRDDAHGPADDAAARPLRDDVPARLLRPRPARHDRAPLGAASSASRSRTRPRDEIARRSRGTPRIANRILRRVRDVAEVRHEGAVTNDVAREALELLEVDEAGLERHRPRAAARDRRASSAAARSGSRRSPSRSARSPTRSRTSTSRTCSSSASSSARRAGASSRSSAACTSAPVFPRRNGIRRGRSRSRKTPKGSLRFDAASTLTLSVRQARG